MTLTFVPTFAIEARWTTCSFAKRKQPDEFARPLGHPPGVAIEDRGRAGPTTLRKGWFCREDDANGQCRQQ